MTFATRSYPNSARFLVTLCAIDFPSKETHEPIPGVCTHLKTRWVLISKFLAENTLKTAIPTFALSSLLVPPAPMAAHSGSNFQQLRLFSSVNLLFSHYSIDLSIFQFPGYFSALETGEKTKTRKQCCQHQ